ncbi:GGDEF domain-containing protein [Enterobacteriaceae bacterium 89]|nr:GGDEF domain-containing protein [Enterobacteriaceae bacterium 89]
MKNVQDALRKRQALLISAVITLLSVTLYVLFAHQKRMTDVNEGMNSLVTQMTTVFNDNELIADATGMRYQQIRGTSECGGLSGFKPRGDNAWAINGDNGHLDPQTGTLIARTQDLNASCMFSAAEFIRNKINALNPGRFDAHRYIIAHDASWFYWFMPTDSKVFNFSDSQMASDQEDFFKAPESFYNRLLSKDIRQKADSFTNFYTDKITGETAYSVVSYIYDLSGAEVSDRIVGYLLYDHSLSELRETLLNAFDGNIPAALMVDIVNTPTRKSLCLTQTCFWMNDVDTLSLSDKYQLRYSLPVYLFVIRDSSAWIAIILAPFVFLLLALGLRRRLNLYDIKVYSDPLTGCFTRKILDFIRERKAEFSVAILMDCNKFKSINDTWGHLAGDRALQIIAHSMMSNVRGKDVVIRTGGDEFVILLKDAPVEVAKIVIARIAKDLASQAFLVNGESVPLSVSWGVAEFQEDLDTALQQADADMYRMKQARYEATLTL